jgi:hypothetical protein
MLTIVFCDLAAQESHDSSVAAKRMVVDSVDKHLELSPNYNPTLLDSLHLGLIKNCSQQDSNRLHLGRYEEFNAGVFWHIYFPIIAAGAIIIWAIARSL